MALRILLIDVDSTIPNLALMKISSYHKSMGDEVELKRLGISYYPDKRTRTTISTAGYDAVYLSAIFGGTMDCVDFDLYSQKGLCLFGGTGISLDATLPDEIDEQELDYSIYSDNDTAYGFISRGCDRKCHWCVVPQKEGKIHQVEADLENIIRKFKKVKFMDNNFLQLPNHVEILEWLAERKIKCQFNQGLDIRLITEENSAALFKLNYMGEYIFAFDNWGYRRIIERQLKLLQWIKPWGAKFYVYVNPAMPLTETVKRVEFLRNRKLLPYVMRDIECWGSEHHDFYVDLAAYGNQPAFFKKMAFEEFIYKRHPGNRVRADKSAELFRSALK